MAQCMGNLLTAIKSIIQVEWTSCIVFSFSLIYSCDLRVYVKKFKTVLK